MRGVWAIVQLVVLEHWKKPLINVALERERIFTYDKAGQKTSEIDPSCWEVRYSYNQLCQVSEITDAAGRSTTYEYLPGGLLGRVANPDGTSTEYT